jgi:hypothetical protein
MFAEVSKSVLNHLKSMQGLMCFPLLFGQVAFSSNQVISDGLGRLMIDAQTAHHQAYASYSRHIVEI